MAGFRYELNTPFDKRKEESKKLKEKYINRVPVIIKKADNATNTPDIDKEKYLVPKDLDIAQFLYVIRKRIKLSPDQAVFLFCNNETIPMASKFGTIYEEKSKDDGFLYLMYSLESTFGFSF